MKVNDIWTQYQFAELPGVRGGAGRTKSSSREMKSTFRTFFRRSPATGFAVAIAAAGEENCVIK